MNTCDLATAEMPSIRLKPPSTSNSTDAKMIIPRPSTRRLSRDGLIVADVIMPPRSGAGPSSRPVGRSCQILFERSPACRHLTGVISVGSAADGGEQRLVRPDQNGPFPGDQRAIRTAALGDPLVGDLHRPAAVESGRP